MKHTSSFILYVKMTVRGYRIVGEQISYNAYSNNYTRTAKMAQDGCPLITVVEDNIFPHPRDYEPYFGTFGHPNKLPASQDCEILPSYMFTS